MDQLIKIDYIKAAAYPSNHFFVLFLRIELIQSILEIRTEKCKRDIVAGGRGDGGWVWRLLLTLQLSR